jgi:4,5-dihydroxyphthalate decarboxylase
MTADAIEVKGGDHEHVLEFAGASGGRPFAYRHTPAMALSKVVLGGQPFDATEYSLANHIMLHATGARKLPAIPVFPSRAFRNSAIFVAKDSGFESPAEFAGKRVGVSEFAMTAAVWARGHLHDDHGLDWRDIDWITGPDPRFPTPAGIHIQVRAGNLEAMLVAGEIDAIVTGKPKDRNALRCLIPFPAAQERAYFDSTGIFPIMHTVVLHERHAADGALPRDLFDAYVAARRRALERKLSAGFLPFAERLWDAIADGQDATRYGLTDGNRRAVETLTRFLHEQGFIDHRPNVDSLFVAGSETWTD